MISERAKRVNMKELEIFDRFEIDKNLPKYKKVSQERNVYSMGDDGVTPEVDGTTGGNFAIGVPREDIVFGTTIFNATGIKPTIKERLVSRLLKIIDKEQVKQKQKVEVKIEYMPILDFFTSLSTSYKELTPIGEIAEHYEAALKKASIMGQKALVEKLKDLVDVVRGESHLISIGLKEYVTEEQLYDFYEKVGEDKNLQLTWIKNFSRVIPDEVYEAKVKADEREIFDNYVILHYDPNKSGKEMTKEEKEKKKDPILFGVIKNSRKLYYIADWKDEYCDLTLEDMFSTLGKSVPKISYKTVKTFIDKAKVDIKE